MRIDSIELRGYKRMSMVGHYFKLTPIARTQLILGPNGAGKSSLVAELSPLPADKNFYDKNGSKAIEITHAGNKYLLVNAFGTKHEHSFVKNDNELNPGGTITAQRELCEMEFGITKETQELITGLERFTTMSPARRREWYTRLSDQSYDYALAVFAKAKETQRDTSGALKLAKKRLVNEMAKIASEEETLKLEKEIQAIMAEIDILYRHRSQDIREVYEIESERLLIETDLMKMSRRVLMLREPGATMFSPAEINSDVENIKVEITTTKTLIEVATKEFLALQESHNVFLKTGNADAAALNEQIKALQERRNGLLSSKKLGLEHTDAHGAQIVLSGIYEALQRVFLDIPENADRHFSQGKLFEARESAQALKEKLINVDQNLEKLRHSKQHMDQLLLGDKTECPKCKHSWTPGFSPSIHAEIGNTIEKHLGTREKYVKEQTEIDKVIADNVTYGEFMREYIMITRGTPALNSFWNYIRDNDLLYAFPRQCNANLAKLKTDLETDVEILDIEREIARLRDLVELAAKASDTSVANVTEKMELVEANIGNLTKRLGYLNNQLQQNQLYLNKIIEMLALDEKIQQYVKRLQLGTEEMVRSIRNEVINVCLQDLQGELARKQTQLNAYRMQQGIVNDISRTVETLLMQEEAHKLVVQALSPTDGLIAEGLLGFIKSFVKKMNIVIRKIWAYPMEVKDCNAEDAEGAELDYAFPLMVNDEDNLVPDVSKGSTGQREVVDLSFKIVATHCLGLSEAPLYLDEFASSFDEQHRVNASAAIATILEQMPFSQLFMISHYESNHGALTQADVCVLNGMNITTPAKGHYNQHVVIK